MRKHQSTKSIKIPDNQSKQINSSIWSLANQLVEVIPLAVARLGHYWVLDCSRIRHVRSWESITKLRLFHVFPCHPGILATQSQLVVVASAHHFNPFRSSLPLTPTTPRKGLPTLRSPSGRSGDPKSSKPGALAAPEIQQGIKAIPAIFGIIVVIQIPSRYITDAKCLYHI